MWDQGGGYERFMGRWSRRLGQRVVDRALRDGPARDRWLDIGCGTGSLTAACLAVGVAHVDSVDPSPAFAATARARFAGAPVRVHVGDAEDLAGLEGPYDVALSTLVLNFTPDPAAALAAMRAVLGPSGTAWAAVWDYADERSFLARFWRAVEHVEGAPVAADERHAFPICTPAGLAAASAAAGWRGGVQELDVATTFTDATDLWDPFLTGVGPAGSWTVTQDPATQAAVRDRFLADVFAGGPGPVTLPFRALVVTTDREEVSG